MVPACADDPYAPDGETEKDVHRVKLWIGKDGRAQITSNWSTLVTTSCMSDGGMAMFKVEPNDEDVPFIHMWSNLPIGIS
jgi:hypothetical protein